MTPSQIWLRLASAGQRRAARWLGRQPFAVVRGRPLVSFTFDDFPRSALVNGGAILERFGAGGTYYTALGLAGQTTECGEMFVVDDLSGLMARGHELGCHTFDHCPAWSTPSATFEASVQRNAKALRRCVPGARFGTLSYPISYPRPETKRRLQHHFACCRGGGQRFNTGTIDASYLSAFFLEQSRGDPEAVKPIVLANAAAGGWLIFATHDVSAHPTRFGCATDFFEQIVRFVVESGAQILPVGHAWDTLRARLPPGP